MARFQAPSAPVQVRQDRDRRMASRRAAGSGWALALVSAQVFFRSRTERRLAGVEQLAFGVGVGGGGVGDGSGLLVGQFALGQGLVDVGLVGQSCRGVEGVLGGADGGSGGVRHEVGRRAGAGGVGGAGLGELADQAQLGACHEPGHLLELAEQRDHRRERDGVGVERLALGPQVPLDGGDALQVHAEASYRCSIGGRKSFRWFPAIPARPIDRRERCPARAACIMVP